MELCWVVNLSQSSFDDWSLLGKRKPLSLLTPPVEGGEKAVCRGLEVSSSLGLVEGRSWEGRFGCPDETDNDWAAAVCKCVRVWKVWRKSQLLCWWCLLKIERIFW